MKITDVRVWLVQGLVTNWTFVKIYTDEGLTGVGESTNWPGSPIIEAATRHVGQRIIGLDPTRIEYIWTKLYRDMNWVGPTGASLCAISGINMALMDLKAKMLNVPCYELMGGAYRKDILLYANYWFYDCEYTPESYAKKAAEVVSKGFTGLKLDPFAHTRYLFGDHVRTTMSLNKKEQDHAYRICEAVRQAVGQDVDIMIETHALMNFKTAITMAERLAVLDITWYEEPAGPENSKTLSHFRERLDARVSICVGERHYTRYGIRELLENGICDIIMPDISRCGGPSEMKKMADYAEVYNVLIAPHNPNGPLCTLANAHVCAAIPNFFRLEFFYHDVPWRDEVISYPIDIREGKLYLSGRPGLGVEFNEKVAESHPAIVEAREGFYV